MSSKQPQPEHLRDWYPYYAGFPSTFVASAIRRHFQHAKSIVDPWNGAGTTTAVAGLLGLRTFGLDINPAVTVMARARLTPLSVKDSLDPLAEEIATASNRLDVSVKQGDPLSQWMRKPGVDAIRRLQAAINVVLVGDPDLEKDLAAHASERTSELPILACFYYTALFAVTRDLLSRFRATNPTWLRFPSSYRHRIQPSKDQVRRQFSERVRYLSERLAVPADRDGMATIVTGSLLDRSWAEKYDSCLTSPPYATRIDYVKSSLSELSVLGVDKERVKRLRRRTTGTPLVRGVSTSRPRLHSSRACDLVRRVTNHPSHGSANYYGPWLRNYLGDLELSLETIDRIVKHDGRIGIVVQDSHYKEIRIDLQGIVTQMFESVDRRLICREDNPVRHHLARMNPAARKHLAERSNVESLLVFA